MEIKSVKIDIPEGCNVIVLTTHFIKSVEDIHETLVSTVPNIKFGLGFCEASGPCLVRKSGTDDELVEHAAKEALKMGTGHTAIIFLKNSFPINVLNALKNVPEVATIHCATANELDVLVAENDRGRGIVGVIDGEKSKGIEDENEMKKRKLFLRKIGYKM